MSGCECGGGCASQCPWGAGSSDITDGCTPGPGNEPVEDSEVWCSPMVEIQGAVDAARRTAAEVGARGYRVYLVWTKRDSRLRAQELKRLELVPVNVSDLTEVDWDVTPGGSSADGAVRLTEISPNLVTEDDLYGRLDGEPDLPPGVEFMYEIVRRTRCSTEAAPAPQRFQIASVPHYDPVRLWWEVIVTSADASRAPEGTTPDRDQTRRHPRTRRPRSRVRV